MNVSTSILNILSAASLDGNGLKLSGHLDRKDYQAVAKVIEAAGGKWNRKAGQHVFDGPAADAIDQIILTGEVADKKQELQQFFTPPELADRLAALADVRDGQRILEPSAGPGEIVKAIARTGAAAPVCAYEIDRPIWTKLCAVPPGLGAYCQDFLKVMPDQFFDRVVMNPPFARQDDIRHVLHALKFLKPGGRLVSIMSASVMFRDNRLTEGFRSFVKERCGTMEMLPADSFKASGTSVNTALVTLS